MPSWKSVKRTVTRINPWAEILNLTRILACVSWLWSEIGYWKEEWLCPKKKKRRVTQIFVAVVCRWVLVYYGFGTFFFWSDGFGTLVVGLLCKEALLIFDLGDWYFAMLRTIVVCKWHMSSYFLIDLILLSLECLLSFDPLCTKMCQWEKAYFCF